jgi:hypothetical protein
MKHACFTKIIDVNTQIIYAPTLKSRQQPDLLTYVTNYRDFFVQLSLF